MESFLILSLALASGWIISTTSGTLSDVELMELYKTPVDMKEFVDNIFDLPATEQLYVYEYLQDLTEHLEDDPKLKKFLTSSMKVLQQKTDDFNAQHNLQKVPIEKFLQKRIQVMNKVAANKSTVDLAKSASQNLETPSGSVPKTKKNSDKLSSTNTADSTGSKNSNKSLLKTLVSKSDPKPVNTTPKFQPLVQGASPSRLSSSAMSVRVNDPSSSTAANLTKPKNEKPRRSNSTSSRKKSSPKSKPEIAKKLVEEKTASKSKVPQPSSKESLQKIQKSAHNDTLTVKSKPAAILPSNKKVEVKRRPVQSHKLNGSIPLTKQASSREAVQSIADHSISV